MTTFEQVWARASRIPGWYTEEEARCLYEHAVSPWLEVGSWMGRSATVLAASGPGVCVDTFQGSPSHSLEMETVQDGVDVEAILRQNMGNRAVVRSLPFGSRQSRKVVMERKFDFLHLDADHAEGKTEEAFNAYSPLVISGGLVAFHDYGDPGWPDVAEFCDTLDWTRVAHAGRTLVVRKP